MENSDLLEIAKATADVVRKHIKPSTVVNYPAPHVHVENKPADVPVEVNIDMTSIGEAISQIASLIKDRDDRLLESLQAIIKDRDEAIINILRVISEKKIELKSSDFKLSMPERTKRQMEIIHDNGDKTIVREV